jgi:hypothetical protein
VFLNIVNAPCFLIYPIFPYQDDAALKFIQQLELRFVLIVHLEVWNDLSSVKTQNILLRTGWDVGSLCSQLLDGIPEEQYKAL